MKSQAKYLEKSAILIALIVIQFAACEQKTEEEKHTMEEREPTSAVSKTSRFVEVFGSRMHYVEQGSGAPILFVHGNPTSSYIWRNVIPHIKGKGRCIAVDLIGMGKSDKPEIEYTYFNHAKYLEAFIEKLGLTEKNNLTLVLHDWGGSLGLSYALRNPDKIRAIAFMEMPLRSPFITDDEKGSIFLKQIHTEEGEEIILKKNLFIEELLPMSIVRQLSEEEMNNYRAPYPTPDSRKAILGWIRTIPFDSVNRDVHNEIMKYMAWLEESDVPKLLLHHADHPYPGDLVTSELVASLQNDLKNFKDVEVGNAKHYIQEDQAEKIGAEIANWFTKLNE